MKVIVHPPQTGKGKENLEKAVTKVHINAILQYLSKQPFPSEQKQQLIRSIIDADSQK